MSRLAIEIAASVICVSMLLLLAYAWIDRKTIFRSKGEHD